MDHTIVLPFPNYDAAEWESIDGLYDSAHDPHDEDAEGADADDIRALNEWTDMQNVKDQIFSRYTRARNS